LLKRLAWFAAALIAAWLLWMTLRPNHEVAAELVPLTASATARGISSHLLIDLAGNIVVFVPLGAALAVATWPPRSRPAGRRRFDPRWWLTVAAAGFVLSLGIEVAQFFIPTRVTDVDDVILNTLGTLAGAAVVSLAAQWYTERK